MDGSTGTSTQDPETHRGTGSRARGAAVIAILGVIGYLAGAALGLMDDLATPSDRFGLLALVVVLLLVVFGFQYHRFSRSLDGRETWLDTLARDLNAAVAERLEEMQAAARLEGMTIHNFVGEFVQPRLEAITYMVPIAAFAVTWALLGAKDGTLEFLTTSSQVIPVLILALALEGNIFRLQRNRHDEWTLLSFTLLALMAIGEIVSVNALLESTPRGADVGMAAIVAGLVAVVSVAVFGHGDVQR